MGTTFRALSLTLIALLVSALSATAGTISGVQTEKRTATIGAQIEEEEELLVFIGDESLGWSGSQKAGAVKATFEASSQIRLEDGSVGSGFIFRVGGTMYSVAITPGGPVPFGELVLRTDNNISAKDGIFTFADIRKPDGELVPVSVRVRAAKARSQ